jgi:hypothetical protein
VRRMPRGRGIGGSTSPRSSTMLNSGSLLGPGSLGISASLRRIQSRRTRSWWVTPRSYRDHNRPGPQTTTNPASHPRRTLQRRLAAGKLTPYAVEGDRRRYVDLAEVNRLREPKALQEDFSSLAADLRRLQEEQAVYRRALLEGTESPTGLQQRSAEFRRRQADLIERIQRLAPVDDPSHPGASTP